MSIWWTRGVEKDEPPWARAEKDTPGGFLDLGRCLIRSTPPSPEVAAGIES